MKNLRDLQVRYFVERGIFINFVEEHRAFPAPVTYHDIGKATEKTY